MEEAIADANEMFNNMGITTQYEQVFDDESEIAHAAGMEQSELNDDEEQEEDALYARDLPTPNMAAWVITDVRTDTTFTEFWETYLLHMEDTRAEVTIQLIEWRSLLGRTAHEGLLEKLRRYEVLYGSINRAYTLVAYGRVYRLVEGAKALMDRTDWYSFQDLQRHMWYTAFTPMEWYDLFTLLIDNGMLLQLFPEPGVVLPNHWRSPIRNVPVYRRYRRIVDMVLRQNNTMYEPLLQDQNVSQYLIPPSDHSINVPYLSWYIAWASDCDGNYVETGYPNTTGHYLPIFWDRHYDTSVIIPTVNIYPAIFFDSHERVEYMQHITAHIPFDTAIQLVTNAVMNNVQTLEECKEERDFKNDMEIALPSTVAPGQERLLDVIHVDDDMDETRSLIWVQCRRCKWSCPVESYIVGDCQCTWGPAEGLEEDMQALDMAANIMGEWSELDDTHEVHSVHGDSTEKEMTDTSSDDMPPLVDAADDSDHEAAEVPALLHNVVLTMPIYPISAELSTIY
jgi:hypothetical protein